MQSLIVCRHCHRPLSTDKSIAAQAGPDCRRQHPHLYPPKRRPRTATATGQLSLIPEPPAEAAGSTR